MAKKCHGNVRGEVLVNSLALFASNPTFRCGALKLLLRRLFVTCAVFTRYFLVAFPWLFRGPLLSRKTVFGPFRGFFVAFFWQN